MDSITLFVFDFLHPTQLPSYPTTTPSRTSTVNQRRRLKSVVRALVGHSGGCQSPQFPIHERQQFGRVEAPRIDLAKQSCDVPVTLVLML